MSEPVLLREEDGGVVTLTLNRPEAANALSCALVAALDDALDALRFDPQVRAVILTGAGGRVFCAGADLKERRGMDEGQVRRAVDGIRSAVERVAALPVPVIAALEGAAFGGGLELALACDLRIAAKGARMGLTETSLAIIPGAGGTQRLPRLIGAARAKELIYTARRISADEALAMGLVNRVVPDGQALAEARALAAEIAVNGPVAVRQAKFAIDQGLNTDLTTGLALEREAYERVIPTEDRLEGLAAFAEKRRPKYKGR
ncbi:enoyl-CoA hydratase [Alicyclobacillus sp.]|uniref:enoyl-CoA hydratase n=1 Tax=Alicyclobacillus sp. TaxID=61169 RepID=UPI0025BD8133|nr:enoyl-CoA hydratase [Alicyclobacillus sp.]MCL6515366.1 enoyl-CoA hydratase [Alicyclobacillus sp.]